MAKMVAETHKAVLTLRAGADGYIQYVFCWVCPPEILVSGINAYQQALDEFKRLVPPGRVGGDCL